MSFAWSYSFLNDFRNCPYKAFRKYVLRDLPKETSPALEEGIRVHYELEQFINADAKPDVGKFAYDVASRFRERGAEAEKKLGMFKTRVAADFWDSDVWGRGKVDVLVVEGDTALIVDWKAGKKREDPTELKVQALLVQCNYPVAFIHGCYVWLKNEEIGKTYDLSEVSSTYSEVCETMYKAEECGDSGHWTKKPNALCGWCPVRDCEHNTVEERK